MEHSSRKLVGCSIKDDLFPCYVRIMLIILIATVVRKMIEKAIEVFLSLFLLIFMFILP